MIKNEQQEIGFVKGVSIGEQRYAEQTARNMPADGFSTEQTVRLTGFSAEQVQGLQG